MSEAVIFASIGMMLIFASLAYFIYVMTSRISRLFRLDDKYEFIEEVGLDNYVQATKGIDLVSEEARRAALGNKSFRKRLSEELVKDFFDKKKGED